MEDLRRLNQEIDTLAASAQRLKVRAGIHPDDEKYMLTAQYIYDQLDELKENLYREVTQFINQVYIVKNPLARSVLMKYYLDGLTMQEVAAELYISKRTAEALKAQALSEISFDKKEPF